ncbi:MAG: HpcH/HpaI aldolase/citrate lyase family protein [Thermomicrobiales bacterium]
MQPQRSVLAVPASNWRMIEKAIGLDADVAFLDIEDAVALGEKAVARANVVRAFRELDWGPKPRAFRVNGLETLFFYRDLIDVIEGAAGQVDVVILPKVRRAEDIYVVATLLDQLEGAVGIGRRIGVEVQIESAEGLFNAPSIARASDRVEALIFGPGDYAASVGMPAESIGVADDWDAAYGADRWHYATSAIVVAARAAGVRVIDGPYADYHDAAGLLAASKKARALGYDGKWCIHPSQISIVNEVFTPSPREIARARTVVAAYEAASAGGKGAISVDGTMIDAASIRMARRVLDMVSNEAD